MVWLKIWRLKLKISLKRSRYPQKNIEADYQRKSRFVKQSILSNNLGQNIKKTSEAAAVVRVSIFKVTKEIEEIIF